MSRIEVDVRGLRRLSRKLEEVPGATRDLMERAVKFAHEEARKGARPHSVDKGTLAEGLRFEIAPGPVPLQARVYPTRRIAGIALTVEEGRRPGRRPPVEAIGRWARRHGIATNPWRLAREIGQRGTKGIKFMARAVELTKRKLPELVREVGKEVEGRWKG